MIALLVPALLALAAVVLEIVIPGRSVYHAGWYNVLLLAFALATANAARKRFRQAASMRMRLAIVALVLGAVATATAGAASGLLGPDNQTIVGAPGQRVRVEGLGVLSFPFSAAQSSSGAPVELDRPRRAPLELGSRARYAGGFILRGVPRDVAYVEARDERGNRLTVTQPEGSTFLSPVLLMQHRQRIVGMDLPFDSFNVPAARRVVKAVLFTPAQAAMLAHGEGPIDESAVLFAVDDESERPLPHAIALSVGGRTVRAGGLLLKGAAASYPAVEVVSSPNAIVAAAGVLLIAGAIVALLV